MKKRKVLDILSDLFPDKNRESLLAHVLCGEVRRGNETLKDPKQLLPADSALTLSCKKYVSRGGEKLEGALDFWDIPVQGRTCLDAGCSTGGFTDCLLQRGAGKVYAVDVGFNQLAYSLRTDSRVSVMEKTNIMALSGFDEPPDLAVCDLSFRSIRKAAAHILSMIHGGELIALIKPQFEADPEDEGFSGIVEGLSRLEKILISVIRILDEEGVAVRGIIPSPVKGRKGNQEFFFRLDKEAPENKDKVISWMKEALSGLEQPQ